MAKAREGFALLDYALANIAAPKEGMVDYATGHFYVKAPDGRIIGLTKRIEDAVDKIATPDGGNLIGVNVPGLDSTKLNDALKELKGYIDAAGKKQYTKRIDLSGKLQRTDYRKSVIALCELDNSDINKRSYSSGHITFNRGNGAITPINVSFALQKLYNSQKCTGWVEIKNNAEPRYIKFCTFMYNGKKYAGLDCHLTNASLGIISFNGETNFDIFGIDYYDTQNNKSLIDEITNSITYDVDSSAYTQKFNNKTYAFTEDIDAAKTYLATEINKKMNTSGGTFTGPVKLYGAPKDDLEAVTKAYVDSIKAGLDPKDSCRVATTGNITLSGLQSIDGVALAANNRVLVKNQTDKKQNGIYVVQSGAWVRSFDCKDSSSVTSNIFTFIEEGTTNSDSGWMLTNDGNIVVGTSELNFVQFSGAGMITPGEGITKSGNVLSLTEVVVAGKACKLTYDKYGRVTKGEVLTEADIPNLSWSKITGKPTTLNGYGITDVYDKKYIDDRINQDLRTTADVKFNKVESSSSIKVASWEFKANPDGSLGIYAV